MSCDGGGEVHALFRYNHRGTCLSVYAQTYVVTELTADFVVLCVCVSGVPRRARNVPSRPLYTTTSLLLGENKTILLLYRKRRDRHHSDCNYYRFISVSKRSVHFSRRSRQNHHFDH